MPKRDDMGKRLKELIAEHPLPNEVRTSIASGVMKRATPEEREKALSDAWAELDESIEMLAEARRTAALPHVQQALKAVQVDCDWLLTLLGRP